MSKILLPQRGILHDRVDEGWIVPMVRRPTSADAGRAIAAILPRLIAEGRLIPAMGYIAKNETAMAAVADSETAMAAVVDSETAMAAVFGTSGSPNYMAREKIWDSEVATAAVLGAGRAWLAANVQTESSQSVGASKWWNYSGSKKALVLQGYYFTAIGIRFRYTRAGGETGDYGPRNEFWFDVNIATYNSEVRNNRVGSQTVGVRWVRMQA